jgi:hypothetical protein
MVERVNTSSSLCPPPVEAAQSLIERFRKVEAVSGRPVPMFTAVQIDRLVAKAKAVESQSVGLQNLTDEERVEWGRLREELQACRLGCSYRKQGALDPHRELDADEKALVTQLEDKVFSIKREGKLYPKKRPSGLLTQQEKKQLTLLVKKYPEYARFLLNTSKRRLEFFIKFALRANCNIDVFVQFWFETNHIKKANMHARWGKAFGPEGIIVEDDQVKLLIAGRYEPVQDKTREVRLPNLVDDGCEDSVMTMGQFFEEFEGKTHGYGKADIFAVDAQGRRLGGVNWDPIRQGSLDPDTKQVRRTDATRWHEWPGFLATREEMQERFPGQTLCEGDEWGLAFCASRANANLSVSENHAYLVVYIPMEDGNYRVLPMGLQPHDLPKNFIETMGFLCATKTAEVHFPDESYFLDNREHIGHFCSLDKQGQDLLKECMAYQIEKGRSGHKVFQALGNNCANFVYWFMYKLFVHRFLFDGLQKHLGGEAVAAPLLRSLERTAKSGDDDELVNAAKKVVGKLNKEGLMQLIKGCHTLMQETLFKDQKDSLLAIGETLPEDLSETLLREKANNLLVDTFKSLQMFRLNALDADLANGFFNFLNKVLNFLIKIGFINRKIAAGIFWFVQLTILFSWRATSFITGKGLRVKSVAWNKYAIRCNLPLPTSMWLWNDKKPKLRETINRRFAQIFVGDVPSTQVVAKTMKLSEILREELTQPTEEMASSSTIRTMPKTPERPMKRSETMEQHRSEILV